MMSKILVLLSVIITGTMSAMAQSAGTTSFEFLRSQYSPRGAAMGGNLIAVENDIEAFIYNPGALAANASRLWTITYTDHLIDFKAGHLAYSQPYRKWGNLYAGLVYFNYGSFNETDEFGDQTGRTFSASEFAITLGISNHLGSGFDYGLGLKYILSNLDIYHASAIALDAGLLYTVPGTDNLVLGFSLLNLGKPIDNYTDHPERLPVSVQLGFSKRLAHLPLLLAGSFQDITMSKDNYTDFLRRFSLGGEFDVSDIIKFRFGYQNQINQDVKPVGRTMLSGFSLGLGILWRQFRLDYAYSNFGKVGSQNRLGISGAL